MGKRKYDSESKATTKRNKSESNSEHSEDHKAASGQPQNDETIEIQTPKSIKPTLLFDIKHFRKELAGKQGQTMALTQFLQVCLNPNSNVDYMLEYLRVGGNSHEILRQISPDNKKNLSLATPAFHLFHLIILKVQSSLPHMIVITEEACRYFLNTYIPTVEIMISENSGPRHRKIILNLLTSMVTLSSDLGVEVLNQVPLTPKSLQHVVEKPNYKEKDNVRTAFVHFMTSFLVDGHLLLIKALLEKQGLLSLVIPGLVHDEAGAVLMFLNTLKKNVIDNTLISKTLKLKTFSHQVLQNMFKIFTWKGPPEFNNEQTSGGRDEIMRLLSDILLTLFTSHKLGLYFLDHSLGTSDANKNQNLYKALQALKRPWENKHQGEIVLEIVYRCPDLHRAIINVIEQSFQPQHSPTWEKTIQFVIRLLEKLKPENMVSKLAILNPAQTANFIRFITMPVPLLKLISTGIGIDQTISLYCIKVLVKMLQTLKRYMQLLEIEDSSAKILELKNKLENFLPKHMPAQDAIVSLMNNIINAEEEDIAKSNEYKLPKITYADSFLSLVDILLLNNYIYPASFEALEGSFEIKKILDFCMSAGSIALKYKAVSLSLMLNRTALSVDSPMFKDLFLMLLEVYISKEDDTWIEAKDTLQQFFKSTHLYESDDNEVHLMLYALRNSNINSVSLIAEVVEHVLVNKTDLGLQVSEEGTQTNLDVLFDDLMYNRNNVSSTFLATKLPSQFIMGCIRFIDGSKVMKKSLKSFLNLYVANLLHCNYSPELTEIVMGDYKLDVRSYVADWAAKPVTIPEGLSNDDTLQNISKSIVNNEDIPLTTIFPLMESAEDTDLKILDVAYKIDLTRVINSTDFFIFAKYLMFCVVRLTQMGLYGADQQKKILIYFEIIIALAKEHHLLNVCRDIILNLFRNAHILEIYQPIDFGKSPSNVVATEFLLQIIEQNKDIVNNLNKKYSILRSYQKKTFSEISKAFIKVNKKKHISSDLIVKVLNVIGLSHEDDLLVFEAALGIEVGVLCAKDREPSLVFDLLTVLLEKYSKSITSDISSDTFKKIMDLYFTLLTGQGITPNLTSVEESLIKYFENKPHQAIQISEEDFKKFFYANTVRKTTSQLALVLLKYNKIFCNIFKEEINRPEVLSQREITLPLGNAFISHNQFLVDNKDILKTIYEEYKTNIKKFLEKPHKAGQVYISSTKFLMKLVIECMDIQDCQKIFSKNNKFETVELSHIEILQVVFLKLCLSEESLKKEYLINYFLSMLNLAAMAMKERKTPILDVLSKNMNIVLQVTKAINTFKVDEKQDFKKITESGIWQNFCKCVLKDSLKVRTLHNDNVTEPKLLSLLSSLVKMFYPSDHEDIINLFDMVTSHSEFLNVMLSHHSPDIKLRLLEFLFVLISTNKSIMKTQQIPVYLSAYHATRSPCDRLLLSILQFYEANDLPVNEFKPYIWGDSAANHYAVRKSRTSTLWGHPTPNQVMNLFDKEIIENTIKYFPVNQKLDYNFKVSNDTSVKNFFDRIMRDRKAKSSKDMEEAIDRLVSRDEIGQVLAFMREKDVVMQTHVEDDNAIYDPAFVLPLLSHLLSPGSVASSFKLLRCGLLSLPVMALSSLCERMRAAAYHVLHRFHMLLDTETRHKNDKLLLTDFITTLRQSLSTAVNTPSEGEFNGVKNPKLPAIGAVYLARALMVSTSPSEPLYKPVNNFLIAKQFVDLTVVPDFLSLFHDSDVESLERRLWILDIIKDGTKTMTDVNVVFKTMCIKMIMDFYNTTIADKKTKLKILGALNSMITVPRAFEILVEGYGVMSWLHFVVRNIEKGNTAILKGIAVFIGNIIHSMALNLFARHCGKFFSENSSKIDNLTEFKVKTDMEYEILSIVYDLLPHVESLTIEDVVDYVKLYNLITKRSIKFLSKKQILNVVTKCSERLKNSESMKFIHQSLLLNNSVMLCSKTLAMDIVTCEDRLISELKNLVRTYTS